MIASTPFSLTLANEMATAQLMADLALLVGPGDVITLSGDLGAGKTAAARAMIRHLAGEISLDEAAHRAKLDTRHYAKRQFTWFRHQLPEFEWVAPEAARGWVEARIR